MSYDFLGHLFGKARRRSIEQQASTIFKTKINWPVLGTKINWPVLGTKIVAAAGAAVVTATIHGTLPPTLGGVLTLATGGIVAAGPSILQASGLFNAVSPDTLSVAAAAGQKISQSVSALINAPADKRQQDIQSAVKDAVSGLMPILVSQTVDAINKDQFNRTNMNGIPADQLGKLDTTGKIALTTPETAAQGILTALEPIVVSKLEPVVVSKLATAEEGNQ